MDGDVTDCVTDYVIVLCTAGPGGADAIAKALVEEGLAACVNIAQVRSYFTWQGKLSDEREELMIIKTARARFDEVRERIRELHPYEVPEILMIPIIGGDGCYLKWLQESVGN